MIINLSGSRFFVISVSIFLLVVSTIILATHAQIDCLYSYDNNNWQECASEFNTMCSGPAIHAKATLLYFEQNASIDLVCPWTTGVVVSNSVSFLFSFALLLLIGFIQKIQTPKLTTYLAISGGLAVFTLLVTVILMMIDLKEGHGTAEEDFLQTANDITYTQFPYMINALSVFLTLIAVIFLTAYGLQTEYKQDGESVLRLGTIYEE